MTAAAFQAVAEPWTCPACVDDRHPHTTRGCINATWADTTETRMISCVCTSREPSFVPAPSVTLQVRPGSLARVADRHHAAEAFIQAERRHHTPLMEGDSDCNECGRDWPCPTRIRIDLYLSKP